MCLGCVCFCFYIQFFCVYMFLGCFHSIGFFRFVLGIMCEWMPRLLMGGHFDPKFFKKNEQKMKRGPLGCSMIWNSMLERLG